MKTLNTSLTEQLNEAVGSHRITHIVKHEHGKISVTIEVKLSGHYRIFHACSATEAGVVRSLSEQVKEVKSTGNTINVLRTVMTSFM